MRLARSAVPPLMASVPRNRGTEVQRLCEGRAAEFRAKDQRRIEDADVAVDELDAIALLCRLISLGSAGERLLEGLARRATSDEPPDPDEIPSSTVRDGAVDHAGARLRG